MVLRNIEKETLNFLKYDMFLDEAKVFIKLSCASEHCKKDFERLEV